MAIFFTGSSTDGFNVPASGNTYITLADEVISRNGDAFTFVATVGGEYILFGQVIAQIDGISSVADADSNVVVVHEGASVFGGSDGITLRGDDVKVTNNGSVIGNAQNGISIEGERAIAINTGFITAESRGITLRNSENAKASNYGIIDSTGTGIRVDSEFAEIVNGGTVTSDVDAISLEGSGVITNTGTISGERGVSLSGNRNNEILLVNTGTIISLEQNNQPAVEGGEGEDTVKNSGLIDGDIMLGDDDDRYDGRNGIVNGTVEGNEGDDVLLGGAEENVFNGGVDKDTLKGRGGDDDLTGASGGDKIYGGGGNDSIVGGGGKDSIKGGSGDDTMDGGDGTDVLKGGSGNDVFVFSKVSHSANNANRDVIKDFNDSQDKIDLSALANLTFIGSKNFSGDKAEVRATTKSSGDTIIRIDADGDGDADSLIELSDFTKALDAGDFIF